MIPEIPDIYKDDDGCIGNIYAKGKLDHGDSCQRNFSVSCLKAFLGQEDHREFVKNLKLYASPDKKDYYRRYKPSELWYGVDDYRLSRDQSTPLIISLGR